LLLARQKKSFAGSLQTPPLCDYNLASDIACLQGAIYSIAL
jgi:hypothetical protein